MPGLTFSNELISRDEGLHCDFACLLYRMLKHRLTQATIEQIITQAVRIEKQFIIESIPGMARTTAPLPLPCAAAPCRLTHSSLMMCVQWR